MKHDDVVAALKVIAEKGVADMSKDDLQALIGYNLVTVTKGDENTKHPLCALTKKGRVMLKANSK